MWAKKHKQQPGFTIVELLIVIVIIGILAAITIVAFNGVQTRAENTKTVNTVGQYVKAIQLYASSAGTYPIEPSYPCLGVHPGTLCGNVTDGTGPCIGGGAASQSTFDTKMKTIMTGNLPQTSSQTFNCGGKQYRGAWYWSADGMSAQITYFLRGNQTCDGVGGLTLQGRVQADDGTGCNMRLPQL